MTINSFFTRLDKSVYELTHLSREYVFFEAKARYSFGRKIWLVAAVCLFMFLHGVIRGYFVFQDLKARFSTFNGDEMLEKHKNCCPKCGEKYWVKLNGKIRMCISCRRLTFDGEKMMEADL